MIGGGNLGIMCTACLLVERRALRGTFLVAMRVVKNVTFVE